MEYLANFTNLIPGDWLLFGIVVGGAIGTVILIIHGEKLNRKK